VSGLLLYSLHKVLVKVANPGSDRTILKGGWAATACCAAAIVIFAAFNHDPEFPAIGYGSLVNWIFISVVAILLPLIFAATSRSRLDNLVGQYSYPMYISHYIFIGFFSDMLMRSPIGFGPTAAISTVSLSALLLLATLPIERRRHRTGEQAMLGPQTKAA
jgi:peptidoglycan/LPS O-acetylase OafA/YrhL